MNGLCNKLRGGHLHFLAFVLLGNSSSSSLNSFTHGVGAV